MSEPNIIFFGYRFSPYANKVKAYLNLRRIKHSDCDVLHMLPRPELTALGVNYRRIPVMSIGRDIYIDTKAIIKRLEELFPASEQHPGLASNEVAGLSALLNAWIGNPGGIFGRAASVMSPEFGAMKDPKFRKDRADFFGPSYFDGGWKEITKEAIVHMRNAFGIVEALLQDGRQWVGNTAAVSLADVESAWVFQWFLTDLRAPKQFFNADIYPKTFGWVRRYEAAVKEAKDNFQKAPKLTGDEALSSVTSSAYTDADTDVDSADPLQLTAGKSVDLYPTDFGGRGHHDSGTLVKLVHDEVAIQLKASNGKEVRIHAPRWSFRIRAQDLTKSKL